MPAKNSTTTGVNTKIPTGVKYAPYFIPVCMRAYCSSLTGWPVNFSICWTCMSSAA